MLLLKFEQSSKCTCLSDCVWQYMPVSGVLLWTLAADYCEQYKVTKNNNF